MKLNELVKTAHEMSRSKGWYDGGERNIGEQLALVHSEISEALECFRDGQMETTIGANGKPEGFWVELADAVIRIADMFGAGKADLEAEVTGKMAYNATRPHRHGGKRA